MNIYIENQIRLLRELDRYVPVFWTPGEDSYADSEARAQRERRQRGELNEDTAQDDNVAGLDQSSPARNLCQACGADCGESLWGWCSEECLHRLSRLDQPGFVGEEL